MDRTYRKKKERISSRALIEISDSRLKQKINIKKGVKYLTFSNYYIIISIELKFKEVK